MNTNNKSHIWTESIWVTRKESCTLKVGEDVITREFSIGLTVKSDDHSPSSLLYEKLDAALEVLIAREKEKWLNEIKMRNAQGECKSAVQQIDDLVNGNKAVKSQALSTRPAPHSQSSIRQNSTPSQMGAPRRNAASNPMPAPGNGTFTSTDDIPF